MKRILLTSLTALSLLLGIAQAVPAVASAQIKNDVCSGVMATGPGGCTNDVGITNVIKTVVSVLSYIVGVAAVIMIIIGGLRYVTSGGDSNNISSAKNTIIYAIVGLVIAALAQVIVRFVLHKV
jgi:hypothetical protein